MAPTALSYHLPSIRLNTFNKKRKGALKNLNWSNIPTSTLLTTEIIKDFDLDEETDFLVNEGFYHSPNQLNPFNIKCYLCSLEISTPPFLLPSSTSSTTTTSTSNSTENENSINSLHLSLSPNCAYALIRSISRESDALNSGKKFDEKKLDCWGDKGLNWPRGIKMEEARLGSFKIGWPWEGVEGLPTKEEIAKAGWYFRPGFENDENDQCVCPCCTRTVGGWEEGDDPIALHHKKEGLTCPFFTSTIDPSLQFIVAEEEDIIEEEEVAVQAPKSSKSTKATPANSKSTKSEASGSTRSTGRSTKSKAKEIEVEVEPEIEIEEEVEIEEEKIEEVQPSQSTRSSRRKIITPSSDTEEISKAPLKKSTRATKASKKIIPVIAIPEISPEPELVEPIVEELPEAEVVEQEKEEVEIVPVPAKVKKGKGRPAKSQVQVPIVEVEQEKEEVVVEPVREVIEGEIVVEEEVVVVVAPVKKVPKPKKAAAPKASKGKGKAAPIIIDEEEEEEVVPEADEDIPMVQIPTIEAVVEAVVPPVEEEEEDTIMEELSISTSKIVVEVEIPIKTKSGKSKVSKSRSTTSTIAPISTKEKKEAVIVVDEPVVIMTTTAIVSPSPSRPIKSLPSKPISNKVPLPSLTSTTTTTSTSTKPSKSTKSTSSKPSSKSSENPSPPLSLSSSSILPQHLPRSNPFSSSNNSLLSTPTIEELNLTIKEYYDLCGSRNYDLLEKEMKIDLDGLKTRIGIARGYLVEMCGGEN